VSNKNVRKKLLIIFAILAVLLLTFGVLFLSTDRKVSHRLENRIGTRKPAIYSEYVRIESADQIPLAILRKLLARRNYLKVTSAPKAPGEFTETKTELEIFTRPFTTPYGTAIEQSRVFYEKSSGNIQKTNRNTRLLECENNAQGHFVSPFCIEKQEDIPTASPAINVQQAGISIGGGYINNATYPESAILFLEPYPLELFGSQSNRAARYTHLKDIPELLVEAVLTMEDQRFYQHQGIALRVRVFWGLKNKFLASCWVMVLPPSTIRTARRFLQIARIIPRQSIP